MLQREAPFCALRGDRVLRVGYDRLSIDHLKDPGGAGQRVLQLGDHAGDLIEGLGVLVGVAQEARQPADGQPAAGEYRQRAGQGNGRIDQGVHESGGRIDQGGEERGLQGAVGQAAVDPVELFDDGVFPAESPDQLLVPEYFVDQGGLFAAGDRLLPEHPVGPPGNEPRDQQGDRGQHHDHQGDQRVQREHEDQRAEDRHHAGEQLGKAHQQPVGEGVHIRDHPGDQVAGRMGIQIAEGQPVDMPESVLPDILHGAEGQPVVQQPGQPLQEGRGRDTDPGFHQQIRQTVEVDLPGSDDTVDAPADEDRDQEGQDDGQQVQQQGQQRQGEAGADIGEDPPDGLIVVHLRPPPFSSEGSSCWASWISR